MRALALAALLALGGCGDLFPRCRACIEAPPEQPVPSAELPKLYLMKDGVLLPPSATRLFFSERCGKDCIQWFRFETPEADARAFARAMTGGKALKKGENPFSRGIHGYQSKEVSWWPERFPAEAEGVEIEFDKGSGGAILIQASRGKATVWLSEYTK